MEGEREKEQSEELREGGRKEGGVERIGDRGNFSCLA